jgi:glycosyltransferase involved in cell wall biosynthesis
MTSPKVSILMNCHNGELFLDRALASVLNQTYKNWELIFYNNASTDNTKKIFLSYSDKRFKYYECESKKNLVEARNSAIQFLTGEWIAILDVDDSWAVNKLALQINQLSVDTSLSPGLIFSHCNIREGDQVYELPKKNFSSKNIVENLLSLDLSIPWSSVLFKRDLLDQIKKFNELHPSFHDLDFLIKCSKITKFSYVNKTLVTINFHHQSLSNQKKINGQYFLEIINILAPHSKNNDFALMGICKMKTRYLFTLIKDLQLKSFFLELRFISLKEYFYIFKITIGTVFQKRI